MFFLFFFLCYFVLDVFVVLVFVLCCIIVHGHLLVPEFWPWCSSSANNNNWTELKSLNNWRNFPYTFIYRCEHRRKSNKLWFKVRVKVACGVLYGDDRPIAAVRPMHQLVTPLSSMPIDGAFPCRRYTPPDNRCCCRLSGYWRWHQSFSARWYVGVLVVSISGWEVKTTHQWCGYRASKDCSCHVGRWCDIPSWRRDETGGKSASLTDRYVALCMGSEDFYGKTMCQSCLVLTELAVYKITYTQQ